MELSSKLQQLVGTAEDGGGQVNQPCFENAYQPYFEKTCMSWTASCKDDRRPQFYSTFVLHCAGGLHVHEGYDVHAQAATLQVWFAKLALVHISKAIGYLKPDHYLAFVVAMDRISEMQYLPKHSVIIVLR